SAVACWAAAAASRAGGRACSSFPTTRSDTSSKTSAPDWLWKHSCSNAEEPRKESPRGLPALRPRRAATRRRGLDQAQHQRVAPASIFESPVGDQGRGDRRAEAL